MRKGNTDRFKERKDKWGRGNHCEFMVLLTVKFDSPKLYYGTRKDFRSNLNGIFFFTQVKKSRFTVLSLFSSCRCLIWYFASPCVYSFCFVSLDIRNSEPKQMPRHCLARAQDGTAGRNTEKASNVTSVISSFLSPAQNRPPSEYLRHWANVLSSEE